MRLLFGRASPCSHATHVTVRNLRVPLPSPPLARGTRWHQTRASRNEGPSSTNDLASNGASKTAQVATNGKAADTSVEQQQPDMANELETLKQTVAALQQQLALTNSKLENTTGQLTLALGRRAAPGNISQMTREQWDLLPNHMILVRHGHSRGNADTQTYSITPDNKVCLTRRGKNQATAAGLQIRAMMEEHLQGAALQAYFLTSPYCRTLQTCELITRAFEESEIVGLRQSVQLREQDFGNFQDAEKMPQDMSDRARFGRFWYRFAGGESGADVFDRMTMFEEELLRDMMNGRYKNSSLVMVTHGLTLRIFLMCWYNWTVAEFLQAWNPENANPIVVKKMPWEEVVKLQGRKRYVHIKHIYYIDAGQLEQGTRALNGITPSMVAFQARARASYSKGKHQLVGEGCEPVDEDLPPEDRLCVPTNVGCLQSWEQDDDCIPEKYCVRGGTVTTDEEYEE